MNIAAETTGSQVGRNSAKKYKYGFVTRLSHGSGRRPRGPSEEPRWLYLRPKERAEAGLDAELAAWAAFRRCGHDGTEPNGGGIIQIAYQADY